GAELLHQGVAAAVLDGDRAGVEGTPVVGCHAEVLFEADVALQARRDRAPAAQEVDVDAVCRAHHAQRLAPPADQRPQHRHRLTRRQPAAYREGVAVANVGGDLVESRGLVGRGEDSLAHIAVIPPSTENTAPQTKLAASESRNATASAISSGLPKR